MKRIALTYNQKRFAYSIVTSVLSLSVLLLSILGLKYSALLKKSLPFVF